MNDVAVSPINNSAVSAEEIQAPESAWCEIEETVKLLVLSVTQIEVSIGESDDSVKTLAGAFESMAIGIQEIMAQLDQDCDCDTGKPEQSRMTELCGQLQGKICSAVVALQFHDRLSQRLTQIHRNLDNLTVLLGDRTVKKSRNDWHKIQDELRASYTMVEDCAMFDALMKGATVEQAVACYRTAQVKAREEESDLF